MHKRLPILVAAILCLSYLYVFPRWADWSQNSRLDLVRAMSEQQSVIIDDYQANTGDYALYRGHTYSDKAPGPAFLALPGALVLHPVLQTPEAMGQLRRVSGGGALGATLNPSGGGLDDDKVYAFVLQTLLTALAIMLPVVLGALALLHLLRRQLPPGLATLLTLGYGLGTTIAVYAGNFYSHALVASLLLGAYALGSAAYSPWRAGLAGLLLSWAVVSEYPAALPGLAIGLCACWAWRRWSALPLMALGALPPLALLALYDWTAFGTVLPIGYEYSALWQQQHQTGLMSITYPRPEALWGLTGGAYRGLFVRAPWLLLALPGYVMWRRGRQSGPQWWAALLAPLSLLLFYSSSAMWWGGFAAGPRYIVPIIPFLALASAPAALALWRSGWGRALLVALVALSIGLTWAEAVAWQSFPPDTIANPWTEYTLPAWSSGALARNLGSVLGLRGVSSILPLASLFAAALLLSRVRAAQPAHAPEQTGGTPVASL